MSRDERGRPAESRAATQKTGAGLDINVAQSDDLSGLLTRSADESQLDPDVAGLRRRRQAANRMPPYLERWVDPLDRQTVGRRSVGVAVVFRQEAGCFGLLASARDRARLEYALGCEFAVADGYAATSVSLDDLSHAATLCGINLLVWEPER